jgi:hypothetical protein
VESPLVMRHAENSHQKIWVVEPGSKLPFNAWVRTVESVLAEDSIRDVSGARHFGMPSALPEQGADRDEVHLRWQEDVKGTVVIRMRIDTPL